MPRAGHISRSGYYGARQRAKLAPKGCLVSTQLKAEFAASGKVYGNCFDNAAIESFFGTLKAEYFHLAVPKSIDALEVGVHDYVHYYNHERIKLGLQGFSPVEYRLRSAARPANS